MGKRTLISILLPAKDSSKTIKLAIQSTLFSAPKDSELLVMDDGSSDNTFEIARQLATEDPRLKVFRHSTSQGVASSLNALLAESKGEFIARMDADDISAPWRIPIQINALKKGKADFVFTTAVRFGTSGVRPQRPLSLRKQESVIELLFFNPFVHSTMACKSEKIKALGGYSDAPAEDYELWIRASLANFSIIRLPIPSLLYRVHSNQVTADQQWVERRRTDLILETSKSDLTALVLNQLGSAMNALSAYEELSRQENKQTRLLQALQSSPIAMKVRRRVYADIRRSFKK